MKRTATVPFRYNNLLPLMKHSTTKAPTHLWAATSPYISYLYFGLKCYFSWLLNTHFYIKIPDGVIRRVDSQFTNWSRPALVAIKEAMFCSVVLKQASMWVWIKRWSVHIKSKMSHNSSGDIIKGCLRLGRNDINLLGRNNIILLRVGYG